MSQLSPEQMLAALQESLAKQMAENFAKVEARLEARLVSYADDSKRKTVARDAEMKGINTHVVTPPSSSGTPEIVVAHDFLVGKAKSLHAQHSQEKEHPTSHEHHVALLVTIRDLVANGKNEDTLRILDAELAKDKAARTFGWDYVTTYFRLQSDGFGLKHPFGTGDSFEEVSNKALSLGKPLKKPWAEKDKSTPGKAASAKPAKAKKSGGKKESFRKNYDKPAKPATGGGKGTA